MLLVMPLIIIPLLWCIFQALGGGKGIKGSHQDEASGFNTNLPTPPEDKREMNKWAFYDKADEDSSKLKEQIRNDPYQALPDSNARLCKTGSGFAKPPEVSVGMNANPAADQILQRLEKMKQRLQHPAPLQNSTRLEGMMRDLQRAEPAGADDPELSRINSLLEKVISLQHPDPGRLTEEVTSTEANLTKDSSGKSGYSGMREVNKLILKADVPDMNSFQSEQVLHEGDDDDRDGFYYIDDHSQPDSIPDNMIPAVVSDNQVVMVGATLTFRLAEDAAIKGVILPTGNPVTGVVTAISPGRLHVQVHSVLHGNNVYPVELTAYDLDGLEGIHLTGTGEGAIARETTGQGVMGLGTQNVLPLGQAENIGAQAVLTGAQVAKNWLGHRLKEVKISLPAGYRVLLKNTKNPH